MTVQAPHTFTVCDLLTRTQILASRGGNFQAGIVVSRATFEVLVFSDPKAGRKSGYDWDGWAGPDQDVATRWLPCCEYFKGDTTAEDLGLRRGV